MDLYFTECVKREHSVLFQLRFLYRALRCVVSVQLCGAICSMTVQRLIFFSVVTDANILSGMDGSSPPRLHILSVVYWFELQGNVHLQGVVFPASASLRGRRSAKVGVECVCVELKLTLHQRHRKFSQSPMKVCVMPSEISTQQLFFMVADVFTGVRFWY